MVLLSDLSGGYGGYTERDPPQEDPGQYNPAPINFPTGVINPTSPQANSLTPFGSPSPKGGGGGSAGLGYSIGSDFPDINSGPAPKFVAPKFSLPTAESVLDLPGYKFREQQGRDALEHSAAARGLTRTGGTLKDLASWNQGFASQEYDAEARRQLGAFQANYQGTKDEYAPTFANWQFLSNAALQKALAQYGRGTVWNNPNAGGGGGGYTPDTDTMPQRSDYHSF